MKYRINIYLIGLGNFQTMAYWGDDKEKFEETRDYVLHKFLLKETFVVEVERGLIHFNPLSVARIEVLEDKEGGCGV